VSQGVSELLIGELVGLFLSIVQNFFLLVMGVGDRTKFQPWDSHEVVGVARL
jgi:hypothetical protein